MRTPVAILAALLLAVALVAEARAETYVIPPPPELAPGLTLEEIKALTTERQPLLATYIALKAKQHSHDARCKAVDPSW